MINFYLIILVPLIFFVNRFLKNKKFLLNYTGQEHQIYTYKDQIPLSGGLFIFLFFIFNINNFDLYFVIFLTFLYIFGLLVDLNKINSPSVRFVIQIIFLISFILFFDLSVNDLRFSFINELLQNAYFNNFFVLFCLLVLINGSNFIDGNNCLATGYFTIIFISLFYLHLDGYLFYESKLLINFLILLLIILFFNSLNRIYLGDSGIYLLSLFTGFLIIDLFKNNPELSPYFMANLLWYPAFEILFSFIRKLIFKFSPMFPDTYHFHQLLFYFLSKKFLNKKIICNSLTGIIINIFNTIIIFLATMNIFNTKIQISILVTSCLIYIFFYLIFFKFKKSF